MEKYEKKLLEILGENPIEILERDKVFVSRLKEENERLKQEIKEILGEDSTEVLEEDRDFVSGSKGENKRLKEQIKILMRNNKTLTELVEVLEEKILKLSGSLREKYIYDYERGGWIKVSSLDKGSIELDKKKVDIRRINLQLAEINRLMKLHKEKHLREEQEINK